MKESIMPNGSYQANGHTYFSSNQRYEDTHRHEIFFGTANRKKSIKYGLVVFIRPEDHNMSEYGVHNRKGLEFDMYQKKLGQERTMDEYSWTTEEFIEIFGRSYI